MAPDEAKAQQTAMRRLVSLEDGFGEIKTVAGVDLSLNDEKNEGHAVVVVLSYPDLEVIEARYATAPLLMPYISGLLSFRESPVALEAFAQVQTVPDVIFVDGQGQAHPRGFGIACHLGVLLDVPAIGIAKSRLYGEYDADALPDTTPASVPLWDRARRHVIGSVVHTKPRTNPLFVSPGHKVSVESRDPPDAGLPARLPPAGADPPGAQPHHRLQKVGRGPAPGHTRRTRKRCRFNPPQTPRRPGGASRNGRGTVSNGTVLRHSASPASGEVGRRAGPEGVLKTRNAPSTARRRRRPRQDSAPARAVGPGRPAGE